jgi:REP element-mobilizing transposase RayT
MSNHFHLVIETPQPNLAAGMKWLLGTTGQKKWGQSLLLTLPQRCGNNRWHGWSAYHVMSRGDRREAIFYEDADREGKGGQSSLLTQIR